MASTDFLPTREADLVNWSINFDTKITATPTAYGLTAPQALVYAAAHAEFVSRYNVANDPLTRSPSNILAKNNAKADLIENARELARIIQGTPAVTNVQKLDLGLTVRDEEPTPIPAPEEAPGLDIVSAVARTVRIRLHDSSNPTRRAKPVGVAGAAVFSFVGASAPAEIADWKFEGNTTRTIVDVEFPADVANGATVWLTAFWFNPRAQSGPACQPVSTNIPGGLSMAA